MADCKGPCRDALTPEQLFGLISQVVHSQVVASTDAGVNSPGIGPVAGQGTGTDRTVTLKASPADETINAAALRKGGYAAAQETITATELEQRSIRAVAVILGESRGIPNAYNTNVGGTAPGSHDRGLVQFNDKFFPWITDAECFDPAACLSYFYYVTKHFTAWGPWNGDAGLSNSSDVYKLAAKTNLDMTGVAVPVDDPITGAAVAAVNALPSWADLTGLIGKVLALLTSGDFWKRFGIGALGVLLVVIAVVIFARS